MTLAIFDHKLLILSPQRYLIPQAQKECGITSEMVKTSPEAIGTLIKSYCRESGVRNLQKHIEKVTFYQ